MTKNHSITNDHSKKKFAIVVVTFNRLSSVKRLIGSLQKADYKNDCIDLVISIDNSGSKDIENFSHGLTWLHGEKIIIAHNERLGLKQHIIKCGDLTEKYKNICILEDDLYVSLGFYNYAKQTINFFSDKTDIAGISLYSHQWNPYVNRHFSAIDDGYDIFFLKIASSWGQIWSDTQWYDFKNWIVDKKDSDLKSDFLPQQVYNWSENSWLKFFNKYLIDTNKYFVYPKISLTTNFSEIGQHSKESIPTYQVALMLNSHIKYRLVCLKHSISRYDQFFESETLSNYLESPKQEVTVDYYENKKTNTRFLLTSKVLNFHIYNSYALMLRPYELNIIEKIHGDMVFLYDTEKPCKNNHNRIAHRIKIFFYETKTNNRKKLMTLAFYFYLKSLVKKISRLL